jgi:hypothetical protein
MGRRITFGAAVVAVMLACALARSAAQPSVAAAASRAARVQAYLLTSSPD